MKLPSVIPCNSKIFDSHTSIDSNSAVLNSRQKIWDKFPRYSRTPYMYNVQSQQIVRLYVLYGQNPILCKKKINLVHNATMHPPYWLTQITVIIPEHLIIIIISTNLQTSGRTVIFLSTNEIRLRTKCTRMAGQGESIPL